jgi:hypothetical protein
MGKLVLTRRAGESVKLTEPNGREWLATVKKTRRVFRADRIDLWIECIDQELYDYQLSAGQSISFAGGSLELRPHKRPDQAILAFDFPRDVAIVRTEIA